MNRLYCTIRYNGNLIPYNLLLRNRKSIQIIVNPDQTIIVKAPILYPINLIQENIQKKANWIQSKINDLMKNELSQYQIVYSDGSKHLYLGKPYTLKIIKSLRNHVSIHNSYLHVECINNNPILIEKLINNWYFKNSNIVLAKIFNDCWDEFIYNTYTKPNLELKKMKSRWGSFSATSQIVTLNIKLIHTDEECIRYVIMHEFCHILHYNHSTDFYKLLDVAKPNWKDIKLKLKKYNIIL